MSRVDEIYIQYCDEVDQEIKAKNPQNRDEVYEIVEILKNELQDEIDSAFDDIAYDYCEENHIYDEEEL
ncbi:MAG: hypothetical protein J6O41_01900 [Clostridia bacterium]|nr:hypothetical protein [Clostridia bacterium]